MKTERPSCVRQITGYIEQEELSVGCHTLLSNRELL